MLIELLHEHTKMYGPHFSHLHILFLTRFSKLLSKQFLQSASDYKLYLFLFNHVCNEKTANFFTPNFFSNV